MSKKQKKQLKALGLGALGIGAAKMLYDRYKKKPQQFDISSESDSDWESDRESELEEGDHDTPEPNGITGTSADDKDFLQQWEDDRKSGFYYQRRRRRSRSRRSRRSRPRRRKL